MSDTRSKWYHPTTLEVITEVPRKEPKKMPDGTVSTMRKATLADARKAGLLPSVTSVIDDVLAKGESLIDYGKDQVLNAAIEFPFNRPKTPDEIEKYKGMILAKADEYRNFTADRGKFLAGCINRWVKTKERPDDPIASKVIDQHEKFFAHNEIVKVTSEQALGSKQLGFAGTPDLWCITKATKAILIDDKSTSFKSYDKPYDSWKIQLGAYRILTRAMPGTRLVQGVIDRDTGDMIWPEHEDPDKYGEAFMHLFETWVILRAYDPRR